MPFFKCDLACLYEQVQEISVLITPGRSEAQVIMRICADSSELSLLAYTKYWCRWWLQPIFRPLPTRDISVCAFIIGICAQSICINISCLYVLLVCMLLCLFLWVLLVSLWSMTRTFLIIFTCFYYPLVERCIFDNKQVLSKCMNAVSGMICAVWSVHI